MGFYIHDEKIGTIAILPCLKTIYIELIFLNDAEKRNKYINIFITI